jgi:NIMA (never in mitosis gene a)-related kinase 10
MHMEKHIVHRDLSPANVMITPTNKVKLIDFGLAKTLENGIKVMQSVVGTIAYTCPEILQGQGYTEKADIWSMGCIIYELMSLKPPFQAGNPLTVAKKVRI